MSKETGETDGMEKAEGRRKGRTEGAQTFRRGRALHFLERLQLRHGTLAAQLDEEAFASIRPVIAGELKAVDGIIREFIQVFELNGKPEDSGRGEDGHHAHGRGRRHGKRRKGEEAPPENPVPLEDGEGER